MKRKNFLMSLSLGLTLMLSSTMLCGCSLKIGLVKLNDATATPNMSIHFYELGNKNAGDSFLIQVGTTEILVDGGSKTSSLDTITSYVQSKLTDSIIEYAIITHAHEDHIACFGGSKNGESLFDRFQFGTIIDFPMTNSTSQIYGRYVQERDAEVQSGAKHYTALECYNEENGAKRIYNLGHNIDLEILYNYYYDHEINDENNKSVCFQIKYQSKYFVFTGDLEKEGEEKLVEYNTLHEAEFFKAGHHGSNTASNDVLLNVIKPKMCVVPCVCGTDEYSNEKDNQFPSQDFLNRISKHTTKVYAPSVVSDNENGYESLNGNIVINVSGSSVEVTASNNLTLLKDTEWFSQNRVWRG